MKWLSSFGTGQVRQAVSRAGGARLDDDDPDDGSPAPQWSTATPPRQESRLATGRPVQLARAAAEATTVMQARRGRASYTGERSIGSPDAGAIAVAVLVERLATAWPERATASRPDRPAASVEP